MNDPRSSLILNVDDNEGARYAKTRILQRAGFTVLEAATGHEALYKVRNESPELVLLDVKLPDINGLEVCRRIKTDPETASTLVLQTSAAAVHSIDKVRALDGGADSYLTEPIEPPELIANVRALLRVRHAENALRESEERFRQMAENIEDVFWMLDPMTDELLYVSPSYHRLWGRDAVTPKAGAKHWSDDVHPGDEARIAAAYRALLTEGKFEEEYRIVRPDGNVRWVSERGFPVRDAHGRIYRLAGIASDISERKRNELLLRDADQRKDQFLAMLAHELRNPLAPIRNAIELMQADRLPSAETFDSARAIISRQVKHLSRLVDDLLDVSRITQGKITLRREPVEMTAAVAAALETLQPAIVKKQHDISVHLPDEPLYVSGDAVRISQVIANLLSNACKYTPEHGELSITVTHVGANVKIAVRDNGIGILPDMLSRAFELFVQSESSLERSEGGLGIGLPLARTLVDLHGGTIGAFSSGLGQGSEFVVTLPLLPADQVPVASAPVDTGEAPHARRLLLVDDSVDAAEALSLLLGTLGHDVRTANDPWTALELADAFNPQVIILDIGLPGMDGFELARMMRGKPGTAAALLIALTGYGQERDRQLSREAGFDHHFVKPVSFTEIQAVIERAAAS
ncbi:hybrid sensor histidine kinase/response regulator [Paraburkholderia saeva]|uniref:hybrid sensor histidine kinase/response regulator n=1 Tax=Paraburkholderia saeva TaxID=2777537 RepID=UPI001D6469B2|nr:response regulator [Paraburkholderia saeva]CAG4889186.1 Sensor histidine kinase RcsC [Paraburkholderia saeva]CAG4894411.1 Sensor histidine kinase RcsC [Paraburkholderia saeva]